MHMRLDTAVAAAVVVVVAAAAADVVQMNARNPA